MVRKSHFSIILLLAAFLTPYANQLWAQNQSDNTTYTSIKGTVLDSKDKKPLRYASVNLERAGISTVTNTDGEFLLKIPSTFSSDSIKVSYLSYKSQRIAVKQLMGKTDNTIRLEPDPISLQTSVVRPQSPDMLVVSALQSYANYSKQPMQMVGFYRESVKRNRGYASLAEAVVDIYKAPYGSAQSDAARIYKGRKSTDAQRIDTVIFKLQGGLTASLTLDVVKNPQQLFGENPTTEYVFTELEPAMVNGRRHHAIAFNQRESITIPLYRGTIYIDTETLAISQLEFNMNVESMPNEASSIFVQRAPAGMTITPTLASYMVNYTEQNGVWYYSYARADVKFKVKWKRKLFNTQFSISSEMAITDKDLSGKSAERFKASERVKPTDVITERIGDFSDSDFWGEYNIIEPDASIENAIKKLGKQQKKQNESSIADMPVGEVRAKP